MKRINYFFFLVLIIVLIGSLSLATAESFGYGRTEEIPINYSLIPTVNSSDWWDNRDTPADITYDEISGGDVNALGYFGYFNAILGIVGSLSMDGDPWYLGGTDFEIDQNLQVNNTYVEHDIMPTDTLTGNIGSGALRWLNLYVQNINAEEIDAFNLHLSENLTIDGTAFFENITTNAIFANDWSNISLFDLGDVNDSASDLDIMQYNSTSGMWHPISLEPTFFNASAIEVVTGTGSGDLADIQTYNLITYNVTEANSDYDLRVNFTEIEGFSTIIVRHKTGEAGTHIASIQIWDYEDSVWEGYGYLTESITSEIKTLGVYDDTDHIQDGVVQVRFFQEDVGNAGHIHQFDWVALSKGFGTPSGQEIDPDFNSWLGDPTFTKNINASVVNMTLDYLSLNSIISTLGTFEELDVDTLNFNGNVITDSTGTISLGDEHLTTTGKGTFGELDVDNINIDANRVTSDTGTVNFQDDNIITTGLGSFGQADVGTLELGSGYITDSSGLINFTSVDIQVGGDIILPNDAFITNDDSFELKIGIDNAGTPNQDEVYIGGIDPDGADKYYNVEDIYLYGQTIQLGDPSTDDVTANINGDFSSVGDGRVGDDMRIDDSLAVGLRNSVPSSSYTLALEDPNPSIRMDCDRTTGGGIALNTFDLYATDRRDPVVEARIGTIGMYGGMYDEGDDPQPLYWYINADDTTTYWASHFKFGESGGLGIHMPTDDYPASGVGLHIDSRDFLMDGDNAKIYLGEDQNFSIYYDGTNPVFNVTDNANFLFVNSTGYADLLANDYLTATSIYDKEKGSASSYVQDSGYYLDDKGKINHSKFYGFKEIDVIDMENCSQVLKEYCWNETDFSFSDEGEGIVNCSKEVPKVDGYWEVYEEKCAVKKQEVVDLNEEINVLRQSVFELREENNQLKDCITNSKDFAELKVCSAGVGL